MPTTVNDLKDIINSLINEGKGDLPIVLKGHESKSYYPITFHRIHPAEEQVPYQGLRLNQNFRNAPKGEHILIDANPENQFGDDQ